jgi:site-specific DNA-methyltransferase (adenine-specific)
MMARLVACANERGRPAGRPYYSLDGECPVSGREWARLRHAWTHQHGVTNVWAHPPLTGVERFRSDGRRSAPRVYRPGPQASLHLNQKPLAFMERILAAATLEGDVVWEPFGGLCSAAVAAVASGRRACCAEIDAAFAAIAAERLAEAARSGDAGGAVRAPAGPGRAVPRTG